MSSLYCGSDTFSLSFLSPLSTPYLTFFDIFHSLAYMCCALPRSQRKNLSNLDETKRPLELNTCNLMEILKIFFPTAIQQSWCWIIYGKNLEWWAWRRLYRHSGSINYFNLNIDNVINYVPLRYVGSREALNKILRRVDDKETSMAISKKNLPCVRCELIWIVMCVKSWVERVPSSSDRRNIFCVNFIY